VLQRVGGLQEPAGSGQEVAAEGGELGAAGGALEERLPQVLFEGGDAAAGHGLGKSGGRRADREALPRADADEGAAGSDESMTRGYVESASNGTRAYWTV
jgi:hypothetical protein